MSGEQPSGAPPARAGGGLSLYANLLDPEDKAGAATATTVERAPVLFKQTDGARAEDSVPKKQPLQNSSLRFQPMKRPQPTTQKPKPKQAFPKPIVKETPKEQPQRPQSPTLAPAKSTLADWTAADDDYYYEPEKRQRGGRKKRKKQREEYHITTNWDDIYDPTRPNNYEEYKNSEEEVREVREWKDKLYAHRMTRRGSSEDYSDDEPPSRTNRQFAPPSSLSFAPPPMDSPPPPPPPPPPPAPANIVIDESGDDAYTRRLKLSQGPQQSSIPPIAPTPLQGSGTISRAPVRYSLPEAPADIPASEAELEEALGQDEDYEPDQEDTSEKSKRPGQKGFAERLMQKYGWTKGSGLGAEGTGIVTALQVKVEKRRKRPDAEGGGFVDPSGRGKIIGGKQNAAAKAAQVGKFGPMSDVVILQGMVDRMDLDAELSGDATGGGLIQEIGEECGEKYGRVERVYIHRANNDVFVKFTSQLSALRAVNALEGRIFNGNTISAAFYDTDKFDSGVFE